MTKRQILVVALLILAAFNAGLFGPGVPGILPSTAPFKTDKLSVLIVEQTQQRGSYTADQRAAILGTGAGSLEEVIKTRSGEFRKLDADNTDLSREPEWVQAAFALPHAELPWIAAAGPKSGSSQKLPPATPEIMKVVEAAQ